MSAVQSHTSAPAAIVLQLQAEALETGASVTGMLRKAKAIATKLDLADALKWIDLELGGYRDGEDLPSYRIIRGAPQALTPQHTWDPVTFENAEHADLASAVYLRQPIAELEANASRETGGFHNSFPNVIKASLIKANRGAYVDFGTYFSVAQMKGVVQAIQTLVLNWSLELEKAGVLGEGMTFTPKEREAAGPVSQHFIIGNVGVLGNVSGSATVTNHQSVTIDIGKIKSLVSQARSALPQLPESTRAQLSPVLDDIERASDDAAPSPSLLRSLLTSAKTIAEGAAGNLTAMGIVGLIAAMT